MNWKKIIFISLSLVLMSAVGLWASTFVKEFHKIIDFPSGGQIKVNNVNGIINLISWDKESVEVKAEIKINIHSKREADEILERVEIIIDQRPGVLTIEPDYPKRYRNDGFWDWLFGTHESTPIVNFSIKVPQKSDLNLRNTNGNVIVSNIEGKVDLGTVNGEIEIEQIIGSSDVHTTNGRIKADDLKGSLIARTTNGSISARLTEFRKENQVNIKTTNANIDLSLPTNTKADLKASTVNGNIYSDFQLTIKGRILKKSLTGQINGGGGIIDLSTVNGSIHLYEQ